MTRRRLAAAVVLVAVWLTMLAGVGSRVSPAASWWHPGPLSSWQYDLEWPVAVPTNIGPVQVYDIDYDGAEQGIEAQVTELVSRIHASGGHAICYLETGAWENYRPDASKYPASVLGNSMGGYPDERYVDIRQWSALEPILEARFRQCKAEGFDGVETDIDDSYTDNTGFPLTLPDEVRFDTEVANNLHALGVGLVLEERGQRGRLHNGRGATGRRHGERAVLAIPGMLPAGTVRRGRQTGPQRGVPGPIGGQHLSERPGVPDGDDAHRRQPRRHNRMVVLGPRGCSSDDYHHRTHCCARPPAGVHQRPQRDGSGRPRLEVQGCDIWLPGRQPVPFGVATRSALGRERARRGRYFRETQCRGPRG